MKCISRPSGWAFVESVTGRRQHWQRTTELLRNIRDVQQLLLWQSRHLMAEFASDDVGKQRQDLVMDQPVVYLNPFGSELVRGAVHIGAASTRFLDQKLSGSHIPGAQSKFPVAIQSSAGHIR
jgi:hypothetical protein